MKKIALGLLLLPMITLAQQEPQTVEKPVVCVDVEILMDELQNNKYKEEPVWMGTSGDSYWGLVVNKDTGTWTLIQFNQETGCMIGAGENHGTVLKPKQ